MSRATLRFQVQPTYYSELKFYRFKPKPPVPGAKKAKPIQHTLRFRLALQRIWTSMRTLQTFSIGQLQVCSNAPSEVVRTVTSRLYQLNYVQLKLYHHPYFGGNEDLYQLMRNTGPKAPLRYLCRWSSLRCQHSLYLPNRSRDRILKQDHDFAGAISNRRANAETSLRQFAFCD